VLYATYFAGGFSTDFLVKADILTINEQFTGTISGFEVCPGGTDSCDNASGSGVGLMNATAAADLNYRFDLYPR